MLLKYFYDQKLAHASYMVGCQATGEALIVDPGRDIEIYRQAAQANGMKIVGATETHIHADFVSGARELAECVGARLYLSDEGDDEWKYTYLDGYDHKRLKEGDSFLIGNVKLEVMHTPGHTPEHISLIVTDTAAANRPMGIFTGDFVFVGSVGRPDLLEKAAGMANTAVAGARQMFHSIQRFKQMPDYLQVWPAHGAGSACGKGLGAIPSSTVGYEKMFNPALSFADETAFVNMLLAGQPEAPKYFAVMKQVNKRGPAILHERPAPAEIPADQLPTLLGTEALVIDTRAAAAFAAGHMPGTINIPASSLSAWAGWLVDYERPLYLIIDPVGIDEAVRDLIYIGIDQIAGYFKAAAIDALTTAGQPLQSYGVTTPAEIADKVLQGQVILVDVRAQNEWDEGHIPGALHIMLGTLPQRIPELLNGGADSQTVVVQCRSGARSAIGAGILQAAGLNNVVNMMGGILEWTAAGLPLER